MKKLMKNVLVAALIIAPLMGFAMEYPADFAGGSSLGNDFTLRVTNVGTKYDTTAADLAAVPTFKVGDVVIFGKTAAAYPAAGKAFLMSEPMHKEMSGMFDLVNKFDGKTDIYMGKAQFGNQTYRVFTMDQHKLKGASGCPVTFGSQEDRDAFVAAARKANYDHQVFTDSTNAKVAMIACGEVVAEHKGDAVNPITTG